MTLFFLEPRHWIGFGGQRHTAAALRSGKRPNTHFTGGWVGPSAGLKGRGKSRSHRELIPG